MPETISINNGSIDHQYTFGGEKIKKSGAEGDRYYIGGIEYNENGLEFISIPNGRVLKGEQYQYNLTDHLGNVVVMFEDTNGDGLIQLEEETNGNPDLEPEVLQRNHYYSFGMRVESPGLINNGEAKNKYLYNGKEIADDYGLNWHYYGFRNYDAAIGRFPSIDPIADNFAFVSGYNYAENSPIRFIDLWGLQAEEPVPVEKHQYSATGRPPVKTLDTQYKELTEATTGDAFDQDLPPVNFAEFEERLLANYKNGPFPLGLGEEQDPGRAILEFMKSYADPNKPHSWRTGGGITLNDVFTDYDIKNREDATFGSMGVSGAGTMKFPVKIKGVDALVVITGGATKIPLTNRSFLNDEEGSIYGPVINATKVEGSGSTTVGNGRVIQLLFKDHVIARQVQLYINGEINYSQVGSNYKLKRRYK